MIEIIKRGTKKTCTCNECGCCFSYEDEDIETAYEGTNVFGVTTGLHRNFIRCPQCGVDVTVTLNQTK